MSRAKAVSFDGSVIVGEGSTINRSNNANAGWGFYWTGSGGMNQIPMPSSHSSLSANAVSADGSVTIGTGIFAVYSEGSGPPQAFTSNTGGALAFFGNGTDAWGVSADGQRIVGRQDSGGDSMSGPGYPFSWTASGGFANVLPSAQDGIALAISADAQTIVGLADGQGFVWSADQGVTYLGDIQPYAVSGDGSVVVGHLPAESEAVLWDRTLGVRPLEDVLASELGLDLEGWNLVHAFGVSADGRTIVGWGYNPGGKQEAWIAVIPEPSTGLLIGAGLLSLAAYRRWVRGETKLETMSLT